MPVTNVYQVYVIRNTAGKFYIGLSENVQIRLQQHNQGISKWTRHRGPWWLVWTSESLSLSDARKLENRLKRQKGGVGFKFLTGQHALGLIIPQAGIDGPALPYSAPATNLSPHVAGVCYAKKLKTSQNPGKMDHSAHPLDDASVRCAADALKMFPLLNKFAYIGSKLCQW